MRAALAISLAVLAGCPAVVSDLDSGAGGGAVTGGGAATGGGSASGGGSATGGGVIAANPRLRTLADNTALDLGAFTCTSPGPGDGVCASVTDYSGLAFDSTHHQFLMFGGGHATTMTDTVFAFDLDETLTWKELYAPTPCSSMVASNLDSMNGAWLSGTSGPYPRPLSIHSYDGLVWVPSQTELVLLSRLFTGGICNTVGNDIGGPIAHFSPTMTRWTFTTARALDSSNIDATELDPMSGKIVILGRSGLSLYDPVARTRTVHIDTFNGGEFKTALGATTDLTNIGYGNTLTYFPPNDTFYYFTRGAPVTTFALKLNRAAPANSTLEILTTTGPTSDLQEPTYAFDSRNNLLGGGVQGGVFFALNPTTRTWASQTILGGTVGDEAFLALGYDPLNNVYIFRTDYNSGSKTWAYRWKN